jgi:hypothetical protein
MEMREAQKPAVLDKLRVVVKEFEDLLERASREEELQAFVSKYPVLLSPTAIEIHPKHRLGREYVTDFVIHEADDQYVLVEIESASHKLFSQNGDPSAALSHAQRQVEDWREWVSQQITYAQNSLPGINDPVCWIIIGRSKALSSKDRRALQRKNKELSHIKIMTFDDLVKKVHQHIHNLESIS